MYYVYVLKSAKDKDLYVGSTNDLRRRLSEHNSGNEVSTKHRRPFTLKYYEAYSSEGYARNREKMLKKDGRSKVALKKRLKESLQ